MRSRNSRARAFGLVCIAAVWLSVAPATPSYAQSSPDEREIAVAIEKVKADPNLAQERKQRTLRWKGKDDSKPRAQSNGFGRWIMNFFVWLGQLSRVLMWVIGGLLAIALIALLVRMFAKVERGATKQATAAPTHVRDLDIRPESLPDDIGAAAMGLWERGEHRAALALLYRGLLSRLAHVHRVPIRDSTTEGDCIALAEEHLSVDRKRYVTHLIQVWTRAVYGGRDPVDDEVQTLCSGFATALAPQAGTPS